MKHRKGKVPGLLSAITQAEVEARERAMETTMTEKTDGIYSTTAPVELDFPNLFTPRAFKSKNGKEQGEPKYEAQFNIPADHIDLTGLKAKAMQVASARWPGRDFSADFMWPFKRGDKLADKRAAKRATLGKENDYEYVRGKVVLTARSKYEPKLAGVENGRATDYEGDARKQAEKWFYSGAEVLVQFNFVAYDGVGANPDGVNAYLNAVFTTKKGAKRINAGASAAETFKGYVGQSTTEDPTAGQKPADGMDF